jgi:autoinducer 2-degrading protein
MLVVHVDVQVSPDQIGEFLAASRRNAAASRLEPGVLRFDVIQDRADPAHVVLVEVYADDEAAADHKATDHYAVWRDAVEPWMARPRSSVKYQAIDPDDAAGWAVPTP